MSSYVYDAGGTPITVTTPVLTNTFDITGMRTHKTAQGISSTFVYDAQQKLLSERIGTTNASYVYLGTTPIARFEQKNNQSLAYYFLNDGHHTAHVSGG